MIPVVFHTVLDDYQCDVIKHLCVRPEKGDVVPVLFKGKYAELKIVRIKHSERDWHTASGQTGVTKEPYLEIELHKYESKSNQGIKHLKQTIL